MTASGGQPSLPEAFLERMRGLMGAEFPAFLAAYDQPALTGLRTNTLRLSPSEFQSISPFPLRQVAWCAAGFTVLDETASPGKHPYHAAGLYYLQDPSAMAAAELLAPLPGENVLDLAAAPGGKSTHLAALMKNQGWLVANEIHPRRAWDLAENMERCGVQNASLTNETPERLADHFGAFFDRVLLDAPCSGEGMFRKGDTARLEWKPELVQSCALRQSAILRQAARLVKPGGWLEYTTCTFAPEENEGVIARFLVENAEFELDACPAQPGFSTGVPEWADPVLPELNRAVRIWPHRAGGEGHFIALLRKGSSGEKSGSRFSMHPPVPAPKAARQLWAEFCAKNLLIQPDEQRLSLHGSYLYQHAPACPDLSNLRTIHPGWWLGVVKKDRFEPAHALAMGLASSQVLRLEQFRPSDQPLLAYLRGEQIQASSARPGEQGWGLVCVDGYLLGWGKWVQGVIKNAYPRGLRWHA